MEPSTVYTFVLDLDGGTYLHQVTADTLTGAVQGYLEILAKGYPDDRADTGALLAESWRRDTPIEVAGLHSVWCLPASDEDYQAIVHIIGPTDSLR